MNAAALKKIFVTTAIVGLAMISVYCFWQFLKSAGTASFPGISANEVREVNVHAYKNLGISMVSLVTVLILVVFNRD